jgi:hypothetical protein
MQLRYERRNLLYLLKVLNQCDISLNLDKCRTYKCRNNVKPINYISGIFLEDLSTFCGAIDITKDTKKYSISDIMTKKTNPLRAVLLVALEDQ